MRAVARTVVAAVLTGISNRNTAKMGANAEEDQKLLLLNTLLIRLRVAERGGIHGTDLKISYTYY